MSEPKEQPRRINPEELGIVESSFDPIKTIRMETEMYRKAATTHARPIARFLSILLGLFLVITSLPVVLIFAKDAIGQLYNVFDVFMFLFEVLLSLLMFFLGAKIVYVNIRRPKP